MGLEAPTWISDLIASNPLAGDPKSQGDDHIRAVKAVLQACFPNASKALYFPTSVASQTSGFSVASTDDGKHYPCDATSAGFTVALPATPRDGFRVVVQKTDSSSHAVTLDPAGAVTINGATTFALSVQYQAVEAVYCSTILTWIALPYFPVVPYYPSGTKLPYADLVQATTDARILAYTGTPPGPWTETTLSAVLDFIGSAAQGDILYRGASVWARLGAGTAGQFLQSSGAAANPAWGTAPVCQIKYAEYSTNADLSTIIPLDNTIPQIGEGTEIVTVSITPSSASNKLRIKFSGFAAGNANGGQPNQKAIAAIFRDTTANALFATAATVVDEAGSANDVENSMLASLGFEFIYAPATTSALTLRVRVGADGGTIRMNGAIAAGLFGGVAKSTLTVEEIVAS